MTAKAVMRGALIVFEGSDRVGKSTQSVKVLDRLRSRSLKTELIQFPNRQTVIGQMIGQYLRKEQEMDDRVIHLLFSANRWEQSSHILQLLTSGTTVLIDRYAYSGVAYSAAKSLDFEWCRTSDCGLPRPDRVIYLKANKQTVIDRKGFGDERYEKIEFQDKVLSNYEKLIENNWSVISADKSIDDIHEEVFEIVNKTIEEINNCNKSSIKQLWVD